MSFSLANTTKHLLHPSKLFSYSLHGSHCSYMQTNISLMVFALILKKAIFQWSHSRLIKTPAYMQLCAYSNNCNIKQTAWTNFPPFCFSAKLQSVCSSCVPSSWLFSNPLHHNVLQAILLQETTMVMQTERRISEESRVLHKCCKTSIFWMHCIIYIHSLCPI